MAASTTTSIASDTNYDTRINIFSFTNHDRGQMTIADVVIAMPQCNIVTRTIVIPYLFDNTIHHGIGRFVLRTKIQTVVP